MAHKNFAMTDKLHCNERKFKFWKFCVKFTAMTDEFHRSESKFCHSSITKWRVKFYATPNNIRSEGVKNFATEASSNEE